jgi:hypothetical protein
MAAGVGLTTSGAGQASATVRDAGHGRVAYVSSRRVYLDRGAADGLALGEVVVLVRNGRPIAFCPVKMLADHAAVCRAPAARPGDSFRVPGAARRRHAARPRPLPRVLADAVLRERADAIAAASQEKVEFSRQSTASSPGSITIATGFTVWSASPATAGRSSVEYLDLQLRRIALGDTDLRLNLAATAMRWQTQAGGLRFDPAQLYVWEAEVSRREIGDRTVFAVGRVWPWHVPGVSVLDGVQVGRRNQAETVETGAYGGLLPTALTLAPAIDTWVGGAYVALMQRLGESGVEHLAREEARIGLRHSSVVGLVGEAEILGALSLGNGDVDAGARVRQAWAVERRPTLEQSFLDLRVHASGAGGGSLQLRYVGVPPELVPLLANELPASHAGYHAAVEGHFDPRPGFGVAVLGSWHAEQQEAALSETEGGLELRFPRLVGPAVGLWLGAALAEGWMRSRTVYAQIVARRRPRLLVVARVTGTTTELTLPTTMANATEVGGTLLIDAAITAWLRVRAHGLVRVPVVVQGQPPAGEGFGYTMGLDVIVAL